MIKGPNIDNSILPIVPAMQKDIIDRIRGKGADFLGELKANQPSLRYGVEDRLKEYKPLYSYTEGPELGHGRIETEHTTYMTDSKLLPTRRNGAET